MISLLKFSTVPIHQEVLVVSQHDQLTNFRFDVFFVDKAACKIDFCYYDFLRASNCIDRNRIASKVGSTIRTNQLLGSFFHFRSIEFQFICSRITH